MRFLHRASRVSPVSTSSFTSCRRWYPAGGNYRFRLISVSPCCFHALSTVSATGFACNEATSAFTVRYNLEFCRISLKCLSEGFTGSLSFRGASQATRMESFLPIGLSPTRCCVLSWTRQFSSGFGKYHWFPLHFAWHHCIRCESYSRYYRLFLPAVFIFHDPNYHNGMACERGRSIYG